MKVNFLKKNDISYFILSTSVYQQQWWRGGREGSQVWQILAKTKNKDRRTRIGTKPKSSSETMQFDEIGIKAELNLIFNYEVVGALLVKFVLHVFRVFTLLFMNHEWIFVKKKFWIKKHFQYMQPSGRGYLLRLLCQWR